MTQEELCALDTENMSEEEARLAGIEVLKDELTRTDRALRYLFVFILLLMLIAFGVALLAGRPEGLIVGFLLGVLEFCLEINHDERKQRRVYKKEILPAFESGTYEGSYAAFLRDFQAETIRKNRELQEHMKKVSPDPFLSFMIHFEEAASSRTNPW
jgi:hypothetical protein